MTDAAQSALPSDLLPVPIPPGLSAGCSDEDLVAYVRARYFTPGELAQARHVQEESGYEDAIAFLVKRGQETLRCSDEARAPHVYITIPGGKIFIYRPGRPIDLRSGLAFSLAAFARVILPPEVERERGSEQAVYQQQQGMFSLWEGAFPAPRQREASAGSQPVPKKTSARTKKPHYDAQSIRVGAGKYWHTTAGWVVRKRGLGYIIDPQRNSSEYEVSVVHVRSNWVLASFMISSVDELAHTRIRQLIEALLPLADWTQGIKAILDMMRGTHKRFQWSAHILDIWRRQEQETLFPQQAASSDGVVAADQ